MNDTTPRPWRESGHSDFRGADNHLIGMVNPTGGGISPKRAKADRAFLLHAVNYHDALVEAIQLLQGFDFRLDDSPHGREIRRRVLVTLAFAEQA